jgi:glycosyltransferase involved in cell wall biosynthesis
MLLTNAQAAIPGRERKRSVRVALVCDYLEENWPSMDLFGDMLTRCYQSGHAGEIAVEQLRPAWRSRFSALPFSSPAGLFNADRLANRLYDYPRWIKRQAAKFDLFHIIDHSYGQLALELAPERTIITCHDLDTFRCLVNPAAEPRPRWFRAMAGRTLKGFLRAAHVITPSASTREQLLRNGWFSPDQVTVIPPGVDSVFFSAPSTKLDEGVAGILARAGETYLLHVGSTIRRKRMDVLLQVFARIAKDLPHVRLVRVGGALTAEQARLAHDLGVDGKIVQAPRITQPQLAEIYRKAAILLQTSDAEGFGLPVIEAMACGCPVVASDIEPLREAGGDAADYRPVADISAWSEIVRRLLDERAAEPERWERRRSRARKHASEFTWPGNAERTVAIYRRMSEALGNT